MTDQPKSDDLQRKNHLLQDTLNAMGDRLESSLRLLSVVSRMSEIPVQAAGLDQAAAEVTGIVVQELGDVQSCSLLLYDPEQDKLVLRAAQGQAELVQEAGGPYNRELAFKPGEGIAGRVFEQGQPYFVLPDSPEAELLKRQRDLTTPVALACLPLISLQSRLGVLNISFCEPAPFDLTRRRDLTLLAGMVANLVRAFDLKDEVDRSNLSLQANVLQCEREIAERSRAVEALRQSELKYRNILEQIVEGYYEVDLTGSFTFFNESVSELLGYSRQELMGMNNRQYMEPSAAAAIYRMFNQVFRTGQPLKRVNWEITRKDGVDLYLEGSIALATDEQGQPAGFKGIVRDVTERRLAEEALQESEERHRTVLAEAPDPMVVYDTQGLVTYCNPAFSRIFGWALEEIKGRELDFVPADKQAELEVVQQKVSTGRPISGVETTRLTKEGRRVDVSISEAVFLDNQGQLQGRVVTLQDITDRKKTEEQLKYLAYHDMLTGLPNRKSFYEDIGAITSQQRRRADELQWALLFMDLDRFKYINDTLGHDMGDRLLKAVARRIKECVRKRDRLYRLGGDEFTLVLDNLSREIDAARVAEKILQSLARPFPIAGNDLFLTGSIGIAVYPLDGDNVDLLVKNADIAMYAAKEEGNHYRFFTEEMNKNTQERMRLESNLRTALKDQQMVLFYQPLVDGEGRVQGVEALLRWRHPELGLVLPDQFIPVAEESGSIIPIGEWVLHSACQQGRRWRDMGCQEFYLTVNLSARQFKHGNLVQTVVRALQGSDLPPEMLKLEVTESCIMENPEKAIDKMKQLNLMGIEFSIDDFGTGYSSLSYLKRFPVNTLKIDRSFVRDAPHNTDDQEIIKTIIAMARNLKMSTVAEGVETAEQRDFLRQQGCNIMQGYLFGPPLEVNQISKILLTPGESLG